MTAILLATMLWGGCLSCAQYFMFPTVGAKHCCMPSGECKKTPGKSSVPEDCKIQPVSFRQAAVEQDHGAVLASSITAAPIDRAWSPALLHGAATVPLPPVDQGSPPDLNLLYSVLRI
jgi:hypothetical protein